MNWKRLVGAALGATMAALALGYGSAWLQREACAQETFQELKQRQISGTDMRGRHVPLRRTSAYASISGPFMVEASYMVPYDMHGTLHVRRYWALPWGRYLRSSESYALV